MEVLITTIMRPEGETGIQTHIQAFMRHLRAHSVSFRLVTPYDAPAAIVYPTFAIRRAIAAFNGAASVWWYRRWHAAFVQGALTKHLADGQPRVIYAQCPLSARAALRARVNRSQRVVMAVHFNVSEAIEWVEKGLIAEDSRLFRAVEEDEAHTLRELDALVYVSEFARRAVEARGLGIERIPYKIIPNFVAGVEARATEKPTADLINIGTFEPRKNQGFIVDIVAAAKAQGDRLTATLIGDGPDRETVERKAQRLELTDQIRFTGYVRSAADQMNMHRAYVHGARMESFGIVLIEAMARGLPVFAPPVGGVTEVFRDGKEGRYLPLDDPHESARRILEVVRNPSLSKAMGEASRARFLQSFETESVAPKLLRFLRDAAD